MNFLLLLYFARSWHLFESCVIAVFFVLLFLSLFLVSYTDRKWVLPHREGRKGCHALPAADETSPPPAWTCVRWALALLRRGFVLCATRHTRCSSNGRGNINQHSIVWLALARNADGKALIYWWFPMEVSRRTGWNANPRWWWEIFFFLFEPLKFTYLLWYSEWNHTPTLNPQFNVKTFFSLSTTVHTGQHNITL